MSWNDRDAWAAIEASQAAADAKAEAKRTQRLAERGMRVVPAAVEAPQAVEEVPQLPDATWGGPDATWSVVPPVETKPKGDPVRGARAYLKYLAQLLDMDEGDPHG